MISINIKNKSYDKSQMPILKNLCFKLRQSEIVAIIGPSGVGKTTLLNIISNLDQDYIGEIQLESTSLTKLNKAFIFQEPRLMPWLTVLENVMLVARDVIDSNTRAVDLLKIVGLATVIDKYPKHLSGGMQRRVALARAFLSKPDLILMDEPFVSLDMPAVEKLIGQFMSLWQESCPAVIYVTHDLNEAITVADRILFLGNNPAEIILEKTVVNNHSRSINSDEVHNEKRQLLANYPNILKGVL